MIWKSIKGLFRIFRLVLIIGGLAFIFFHSDIQKDFEAYKKEAVPILMYHSISPVKEGWSRTLCIPEETFKEHLKYLKDNGYYVTTVYKARKTLLTGVDPDGINAEKVVVMTFDDGYENNYSTVYPLMKENGYRAAFYVVGNKIGKPGYMNLEQLGEMQKNNMEIGSHTMSHDPLTIIDPAYLDWEIGELQNNISDKLHFYLHGIAYPNGKYDDEIIAAIKRYPSYWYALSDNPGCMTKEIAENESYALPRVGVYDYGNGEKDLERSLNKAYYEGYLISKGIPLDKLRRFVKDIMPQKKY